MIKFIYLFTAAALFYCTCTVSKGNRVLITHKSARSLHIEAKFVVVAFSL